MTRLLSFIGGHAAAALFAGVFFGLLIPPLASLFRPLLAPAVILLLVVTLLRVDWDAMGSYLRRPWLAGLLVLWMLLAAPILTWLVLRWLPIPEGLATAVVLMAAAPPILGGATIAIVLGLDSALAVVVGLISTLLVPLSLPPLALELLGLELTISAGALMLRLGSIVAGSFLAALLLRRWLGQAVLIRAARPLEGLMVLLMVVFAIAVMDGVTAALLAQPGRVALWFAGGIVANPGLQLLAALAFFWLGRRPALTVGVLCGNRNMGLILAALPAGTNPDVALFFAVAQIPMYVLPSLQVSLYRRLLRGDPAV